MAIPPAPHAHQASRPTAVDGPGATLHSPPRHGWPTCVARMTLEEKAAQLYGVWVGADADGDGVAPHQNDMVDPVDWDELTTRGLGQLTRPFGTAPVDPGVGALALARAQEPDRRGRPVRHPGARPRGVPGGLHRLGRHRLPGPAVLGRRLEPGAGRARWPTASAATCASVGVHQGLAPVLDVVRDLRWGRVEETIGEDPYLVATIGTAYVRGLESAGIVATLKHFAGYAASAGARNLAPVRAGAREIADVILPPFEMALREGGARSVMHSYAEIDGVPAAADPALLTELLRDTWGFDGTVVADYFGIGFLETLHKVAADRRPTPPALALTAGVDVELPTVRSYGDALVAAVRDGAVAEDAGRPGAAPGPAAEVRTRPARPGLVAAAAALIGADPEQARATVDLDPPENRALARQLAEQSVVLLANPGDAAAAAPATRRIAVVGPRADDAAGHARLLLLPQPRRASRTPRLPMGIDIPTVLEALRAEFPGAGHRLARPAATSTARTPPASRRRPSSPADGRRVRRRARRPGRAVRPRHLR